METINIAPTWVWVGQMALMLIEEGGQEKAEKGFVEELKRLGGMEPLITQFRNTKRGSKEREEAKKLILLKCKKVDEVLKAKEEENA